MVVGIVQTDMSGKEMARDVAMGNVGQLPWLGWGTGYQNGQAHCWMEKSF